MIQFYSVSKIYPGSTTEAVKDINLRIRRGEFVFLVGHSGAGKSTILKLIFREELPTSGQLFFNDKNVARMRGRDVLALRRRIGMIFQDFRLLPQKTAFENVALALEVFGASQREIRAKVPEVLARVGLLEKAGAYPHQLSGGEQQRVCIARAIVKSPLVILADEPTGNLDPETSRDLMSLLEQINAAGTTIIVATHAWDIVNEMMKRVVALDRGRIVRDEEQGSYGYAQ